MEHVIKDVIRSVDAGDRSHVLRYRLCGERTRNGGHFLFVKCYCETWQDSRITGEELAVAGGSAMEHRTMLEFFRRVATSKEPVFPCHLHELAQDEYQANAGSRAATACPAGGSV
ncbi:MAG: hypothetical protein AB1445_15670 [Bacillota bacterium]